MYPGSDRHGSMAAVFRSTSGPISSSPCSLLILNTINHLLVKAGSQQPFIGRFANFHVPHPFHTGFALIEVIVGMLCTNRVAST